MHVYSVQFSTDFVGSHGCFGNLFCIRYVLLALLWSYFGWLPPPAHGSSCLQWQRIMYKESNRQGGQVDNRFFVFYALFLTRSIKSVDSWTLGAPTACIKKCQPRVKNFIRSQTRLEHTLKLQARWKMEISCPLSFRWNFEGRFSRNNLKFAWIWDSLCRKIQKFWEKQFWQSLDPVFHSSQRLIIPYALMITLWQNCHN